VAFQRLMARAPVPLAITEGKEHLLQSANPAFCRLTGVAAEEVIGRPFAAGFPQPAEGGTLELLDRVFSSGEALADQELSRERPGGDGAVVWSCTVWPVDDGAGGTVGLVLEVADRSERSRGRRRLEEMAAEIREINERLLRSAIQEQEWAEQAEAGNRAKSNFMAIVSHELRTPLNGIIGYTDVLDAEVDGPLSEGQRNSLERIRCCSEQLTELIDDVLQYTQVEMHVHEVQIERVDLCELARQTLSVFEPAAAQKGLSLRSAVPEAPLAVDSDTRKLRQILLNLLGNAVKFTDRGEVLLELHEAEGVVECTVRDTGPGIPASQQERIFEPFVQAEPPTTRRFGGTGLGLAISRSLAQRLGGDVQVRSTQGEGAAFSLRIPSTPPPPVPEPSALG